MPVAGPNQEHAYRQGDLATAEILTLLKDKYGADRPHPEMLLGEKLSAKWDELEKTLQETIREMVWVDYCASW